MEESQNINNVILTNYELLSDSGLLGYIEKLNHSIVNKNELLNESVEIFNKKSIHDLVHYITSKFLNKFVPETLTFIIQDEVNPDRAKSISFRNLSPSKFFLEQQIFVFYKEFFALSPSSITFEALKVMMDNPFYINVFDVLNPELFVPMMGLEGVYGFIIFGKKVAFKPFASDEIHFIDEIMKFVSISLQNIIHYKRAITDLKTRLYNHDYFMQSFIRELARLKRYGGEFGLLMLDIDHFKNVNDTYGHVAGDKIIKLVARTVTNIVRSDDLAARFGGEEFVIILSACKITSVREVAERIRKKIESYNIIYQNKKIRITVSIGGLHITQYSLEDPNQLLEKVDKALYYCKQNGRNRTTIYKNNL